MSKNRKITNERIRQMIAFVRKRLIGKECNHTFVLVDEFCTRNKLDTERVHRRLKSLGGTCDCKLVSEVPRKLTEIEKKEKEQKERDRKAQDEKRWQELKEWRTYFQPVEESFTAWLLEHKVNESVGLIMDVCAGFMDKPFYEWEYDGCPYDYSGQLRKTEHLIKDRCNSMRETLEAYTGVSVATGTSHYGLAFENVEDECFRQLTEKTFGAYLTEWIEEKRDWFLSFDKISEAVTDEDGRSEHFISEDSGTDEAIRQFLCFEDVVGDCNVYLASKVMEIVETLGEDLFEQIQAKYRRKDNG